MENSIQHKLIELSKIFKCGFTVELKNGDLNQYIQHNRPYLVSDTTLITITADRIVYSSIAIPDSCFLGGWLDQDTNTYYIELNKAFILKSMALAYAADHKQKFIYNIRTGECIKL